MFKMITQSRLGGHIPPPFFLLDLRCSYHKTFFVTFPRYNLRTLNRLSPHDELKVIHVNFPWRSCRGLRDTSVCFHWLELKKNSWPPNMYNNNLYVYYLVRYQGGGGMESTTDTINQPILNKTCSTGIGSKVYIQN